MKDRKYNSNPSIKSILKIPQKPKLYLIAVKKNGKSYHMPQRFQKYIVDVLHDNGIEDMC